jgi:hypothetical protein
MTQTTNAAKKKVPLHANADTNFRWELRRAEAAGEPSVRVRRPMRKPKTTASAGITIVMPTNTTTPHRFTVAKTTPTPTEYHRGWRISPGLDE